MKTLIASLVGSRNWFSQQPVINIASISSSAFNLETIQNIFNGFWIDTRFKTEASYQKSATNLYSVCNESSFRPEKN